MPSTEQDGTGPGPAGPRQPGPSNSRVGVALAQLHQQRVATRAQETPGRRQSTSQLCSVLVAAAPMSFAGHMADKSLPTALLLKHNLTDRLSEDPPPWGSWAAAVGTGNRVCPPQQQDPELT